MTNYIIEFVLNNIESGLSIIPFLFMLDTDMKKRGVRNKKAIASLNARRKAGQGEASTAKKRGTKRKPPENDVIPF